jgi:hypothetical protein
LVGLKSFMISRTTVFVWAQVQGFICFGRWFSYLSLYKLVGSVTLHMSRWWMVTWLCDWGPSFPSTTTCRCSRPALDLEGSSWGWYMKVLHPPPLSLTEAVEDDIWRSSTLHHSPWLTFACFCFYVLVVQHWRPNTILFWLVVLLWLRRWVTIAGWHIMGSWELMWGWIMDP